MRNRVLPGMTPVRPQNRAVAADTQDQFGAVGFHPG